MGPRPRVRHRLVRRRGPPVHEAAQHPGHPARLLLPDHRHRVHAHHGPRAAPLDPGARRAPPHQDAARGAAAHPAQAQPGRGVRDVPADQVRGPEALLPRGRRDHDPAHRRGLRGSGRGRPRRGDHRHGPPRAPQRAGQHRGQEVLPDLPGVRGQHRPAHRPGLRRREVPPRRRGHLRVRQRGPDQGLRGGQPLAPRGGRPGARGHRARQAGRAGQGHRLPRAAAAHPRRRGVRGPGRGRRDAQPLPAPRLPHRRHDPPRRQQPGRLHHLPRLLALLALLHRRGADGAGADLPRQRRRPRGVHPGGPAVLRVPPDVQQGRRHRPRLLPPSRSQRGRRPVVHPAADVRPHRAEALGAQALHRVAHRPRRHHPRRGRAGAEGLPAAARAGLHRGARSQLRRGVGVDHRPGLPRQAGRRHRHRRRTGGPQADRRLLHHPAGRLHRAPQGDAAAAAPRRGDHRRPHRLGHR